MSGFDPRAAATYLLAARRDRRPAGPMPRGVAPQDIAEAATIQVELANRVGALPPGGFKIGATGARMQGMLGLTGPAAGFMAAGDIHASGAVLELSTLRGAGVECEIAVRLGRDLPPGPCSLETAEAAIDRAMVAIELVENRYGPPPIGDLAAVGTPTLIADQVYHVAAVVGSAVDSWRALDLPTLTGVLAIDGEERDHGQGAELLGHPLRGLAWLAGSEVAAAFGGLRAGQIIMLGSVVPTIWLGGPCSVRASFASPEGLPFGEATLELR